MHDRVDIKSYRERLIFVKLSKFLPHSSIRSNRKQKKKKILIDSGNGNDGTLSLCFSVPHHHLDR